MYEHRTSPLISSPAFNRRVLTHVVMASLVLAAALAIGILGYHYICSLDWIDALLNASMILGGMGPVDALQSVPAKLFASFYALFSGLVFVGVASLIIAPFAHRLLHRLHLDE